jgi:very-short-patch-repair endonuclease
LEQTSVRTGRLARHLVCAQCGESFSSWRPNPKYCSRACAGLAKSLASRNCLICGASFQPAQDNQIYCSMPCYRQSCRGRVIRSKPKVMTECRECGKEFPLRSPSALKRGKGLYCSPGCQYAAIRNRTTRIKRNCLMCGKEYGMKRSGCETSVYCSVKCRGSHQHLLWEEAHPNGKPLVQLLCPVCDRTFEVSPWLARHNRKFCSFECARRADRDRQQFICETCGKLFERCRSQAQVARFCSRKCSHLHQGETSIEKIVRQALESMGIRFEQEHHLGRYCIDFYIPEQMIAVEADGTYWHNKDTAERDNRRDAVLAGKGITTVRIPQKALVVGDPIATVGCYLAPHWAGSLLPRPS